MKTETKYFGQVEYERDDLLTFPRGLFGFEDEQAFLLLPFEGDGTLLCLQSVATPQLAFILLDPFALDGGYAPALQPEELRELEAEKSEDLYYYTMCAVKSPVADSTVNLKCPVAVNGDTRKAAQVILEDNTYHMRHRLSEFGDGKGDSSC